MRRHAVAVMALLVVTSAVGCSEESGAPPDQANDPTDQATDELPDPPYTLDLEASPSGAQSIEIDGTTNLPDGALISLSASRAQKSVGEEDVRAVNIGGAEVEVSGGAFAAPLALDESDLLVGVGEFDTIEVLSSEVTVCGEFPTGEDMDGSPRQPDESVRETVGPFGGQLENSPQLEVFGSATPTPSNWLEAQVSVALESPLLAEVVDLQGSEVRSEPLDGFCLT